MIDLHHHGFGAQSVLIGAGLLLSCALALTAARWRGLARGEAFALYGVAVIAALVGARLGWLVFEPAGLGEVLHNPMGVLDPRRGGYSSFGALAGAALAVGVWARSVAPPTRAAMLDALVPSGLAGLAAARLGCLFEACDFGAPTTLPWAMRYSSSTDVFTLHASRHLVEASQAWSAPVHPFPVYMATATLLIALLGLAALRTKGFLPGMVALGTAGAYFLLRFIVEWTRDPATTTTLWSDLSVLHLGALLGLAAVGIAGWRLLTCRALPGAPSS
jgi:phosphatidylglycerol---prolipoprotein diacylglyceryl transferase